MSQNEKPKKTVTRHVVEGRPAFRVYTGMSKEEVIAAVEKEEAEKKAARGARRGH